MKFFRQSMFALTVFLLTACAREDAASKITGWPLGPAATDATPVTAEAMLPGIYPVASHVVDSKALGGFGKCDNFPFPLETRSWGTPGAVALVAFPGEPVAYFKSRGVALRLINRSAAAAPFNACDSRLHLVQEALDTDAQWKPIESLPTTDCGNSFHHVTLPPGQYWQVPARTYRGPRSTKLRFRLDVDGPAGEAKGARGGRGGAVLYSNVFDGAIDPAQFLSPVTTQAGQDP